jgi:hypothetical protein
MSKLEPGNGVYLRHLRLRAIRPCVHIPRRELDAPLCEIAGLSERTYQRQKGDSSNGIS